MMNLSSISVSKIQISTNHRRLSPDNIQALAENISKNGLLSPVEVLEDADRYRLVYGAHRLEAAKLLGWKEIPAIVKETAALQDEADIRLRTISENLVRRELSVLDRSVDIAAWCEIYRAAHTHIKPGRKAKELSDVQQLELSAQWALNFSDAAQKTLDISRRSVFRALKIASISADLRERIALHSLADSRDDLLSLAAEPHDRQEKIIDLILDEENPARSVAEAIAALDRQPSPEREERWRKLSASFGQLKTSEQYRFFDIHADAIAKWQTERGQ